MRPVVTIFTRTLGAIAIAAIPAAGFAQTQASAQPNPAAEHLAAARSALNRVLNAPAPTGDAFKLLSELKTEYIALEKAASTASPEWAKHYTTIDRLAGELIGAPAASGEAGAVGTSGREGAVKVDPAIAANLQIFRNELKAFSTAMSAVAPAASASPSSAAAPATPAPAPAPTTPSAPASGSVVAGTAPKAAPIPAPAAPVAASGSPATPAPATSASAPSATGGDASVAAQIDPVIALIDAALAANPVDASGKVTVDRATLDAIKAQLQVIKAKKP